MNGMPQDPAFENTPSPFTVTRDGGRQMHAENPVVHNTPQGATRQYNESSAPSQGETPVIASFAKNTASPQNNISQGAPVQPAVPEPAAQLGVTGLAHPANGYSPYAKAGPGATSSPPGTTENPENNTEAGSILVAVLFFVLGFITGFFFSLLSLSCLTCVVVSKTPKNHKQAHVLGTVIGIIISIILYIIIYQNAKDS